MDAMQVTGTHYTLLPDLGAECADSFPTYLNARRATLAQTQELAQAALDDDGRELSLDELEQVVGAGCMAFIDTLGCSSGGGGNNGGGGTGGYGGGHGGGRGH
jgi:hypothetical protein